MLFHITFVHWLVIVSVIISLSTSITYIRGTLTGKTKPNRISWSMWALAPLVGTAAALSAHADPWATTRIFLAGFVPLIIFIFSFVNKQSYWKLSTFDIICGICSLIALFVWLVVHSPTIAILIAALGDCFAALPTIVKAWKYPETESGIIFIGSLVSVLLIFPSITVWNIQNSAFQIYLFAVDSALIFSIYRKQLFRIKSNKDIASE